MAAQVLVAPYAAGPPLMMPMMSWMQGQGMIPQMQLMQPQMQPIMPMGNMQ